MVDVYNRSVVIIVAIDNRGRIDRHSHEVRHVQECDKLTYLGLTRVTMGLEPLVIVAGRLSSFSIPSGVIAMTSIMVACIFYR